MNFRIKVQLNGPNGEMFVKEIPLSKPKEIVSFDINNPQLWWTHDLGIPNLYNLEVSILRNGVLETVKQKIGLRDIQLVRKSPPTCQVF